MNRRAGLVVTAFAMFLSSTAQALEVDEPAMQPPANTQQDTAASNQKSPAVAVALSMGTTLGTVGLGIGLTQVDPISCIATLALGISFGPSIGHFYAGEVGHGLLTGTLRLGLGLGGGVMMLAGIFRGEELFYGGIAMLGGAAALAIYDFIDAGFAARRANRHSVAVTPVVGRSQGQAYYGLGLSGSF